MRKNKLVRMIVTLGVAIIMLFAAVGLTACNKDEVIFSRELDTRIKQTILEYHHSQGRWLDITLRNVRFTSYGYYNGVVALRMWHEDWYDSTDENWEIVAGVEFVYPSTSPFRVWSNDSIFTLTAAFYCYGLLTEDDLLNILTYRNIVA